MKIKNPADNLQFLSGGGEMGKLTREKDWSKTIIGSAAGWPQSLRTTLSIILNSKFPMFLFWGEELICFYNDAYRPSLGREGKHPSILGMRGEEAWGEIWHIIKPLIDQVLSGGEASWSEDQLIPIYRNGKIEDVYWTFSYSSVNDESNKPAGVFVTCTETTDKIITLHNLEESKNQLQFAIEATDFGTWDYNPLSNKFSANERLKEWFGLPAQSEIELPDAINAMAEYDRERVAAAIEKATGFSSGGNYDIEYTIINPVTKKERIVHAKGKAWFNNEKIAYRFNGTLEDVTEQAMARKRLEKSEQQFIAMADNIPNLAWMAHADGWIYWYNKKWYDYTGTTVEQMQGWGWESVHDPEQLPNVMSKWQASIANGKPFEMVFPLKGADGIFRQFLTRVLPVKDKEGKIQQWFGSNTDITELKKTEAELKESEKRFRVLADSMPQHIWTSDPEGNLNYYNQSVFDYAGLTPEQINKDGWLQIVHPDDREENIKKWMHSINTGKDFLFEHRFRRHDGQYRWQLSRAIPQKNEKGNIQMWVGTSTDIQEQKTFADKLERLVEDRTKKLAQNNIDLEKMNKELESFAYISSHDLQEPLRKIQIFATRILEKENDNLSESGKEYFKRMQNAALRMQTLIDDLFAYSRTSVAERKFERSDLNKIIQEVKEDLKEDIKEKHATIEVNETFDIDVIPFQFRQLLFNLIGNALKFSNPHQLPHIKINSTFIDSKNSPLEGKPACHISVSDNGIGFDQQYNKKIFEVFQRLHGRGEYAGTGIGLSIVKKIVDNHNGIITATGEVNKGATFDIFLPATWQ